MFLLARTPRALPRPVTAAAVATCALLSTAAAAHTAPPPPPISAEKSDATITIKGFKLNNPSNGTSKNVTVTGTVSTLPAGTVVTSDGKPIVRLESNCAIEARALVTDFGEQKKAAGSSGELSFPCGVKDRAWSATFNSENWPYKCSNTVLVQVDVTRDAVGLPDNRTLRRPDGSDEKRLKATC